MDQPGQQPRQGGLAGAALADHGRDLRGQQRQRDVIDRVHYRGWPGPARRRAAAGRHATAPCTAKCLVRPRASSSGVAWSAASGSGGSCRPRYRGHQVRSGCPRNGRSRPPQAQGPGSGTASSGGTGSVSVQPPAGGQAPGRPPPPAAGNRPCSGRWRTAARVEHAAGRQQAQVRGRAGDAGHRNSRAVQRRERVEQAQRVRVARCVEQRRRAGALHQPSRVHHRDRVGDLDEQRQVVSDEDDREAELVPQVLQLLKDLTLGDHIQRRRRLVHDDDLRPQRQRHRDHDPLPHAARQLVRVAGKPVAADTDHLKELHGPGTALPRGHVRQVRGERVRELSADRPHRVERVHRALQYQGDLRPAQYPQLRVVGREQVLGRLDRTVPGVQEHLATGDDARRPQQPGRRHDQRGLTAAALPRQAEHLAPVQHQVGVRHRVHRIGSLAVIDAQAADLQQRLAILERCSRLGCSRPGRS